MKHLQIGIATLRTPRLAAAMAYCPREALSVVEMPANPVAQIVVERQEQAKSGGTLRRWAGRHVTGLSTAAGINGDRNGVSRDQNMDVRKRPERRQAVQEAKQAVRAYAREPSRANADAVELAWRKVRQCDTLAEWRWGGATATPSVARSPTA